MSSGAASRSNEWRKYEVSFRSSSGCNHGRGFWHRRCRRRLRPRFPSRPLWRMPPQSRRRRGCSSRGPAARRRGAPWSRLPHRLQLALWTLPSAVTAASPRQSRQTPLARGFLLGGMVSRRSSCRGEIRKQRGREIPPSRKTLTGSESALPVTAAPVPVAPAPMTMTPAPVATVPPPMMSVPVMMSPAYLLGLEPVHFGLGRNGRADILVRRRQPFIIRRRIW